MGKDHFAAGLAQHGLVKRPALAGKINRPLTGSSHKDGFGRRALKNEVAGRAAPQQRSTGFYVSSSEDGEELLSSDLDRGPAGLVAFPSLVQVTMLTDEPCFKTAQIVVYSQQVMEFRAVLHLPWIEAEKVDGGTALQSARGRVKRPTTRA